jgi:hypothetical protein
MKQHFIMEGHFILTSNEKLHMYKKDMSSHLFMLVIFSQDKVHANSLLQYEASNEFVIQVLAQVHSGKFFLTNDLLPTLPKFLVLIHVL